MQQATTSHLISLNIKKLEIRFTVSQLLLTIGYQ